MFGKFLSLIAKNIRLAKKLVSDYDKPFRRAIIARETVGKSKIARAKIYLYFFNL